MDIIHARNFTKLSERDLDILQVLVQAKQNHKIKLPKKTKGKVLPGNQLEELRLRVPVRILRLKKRFLRN